MLCTHIKVNLTKMMILTILKAVVYVLKGSGILNETVLDKVILKWLESTLQIRKLILNSFSRTVEVPYSTKHWQEKTLADLAVDSQSAKVLSANVFFHHNFLQALEIKWALIKSASYVVSHYTTSNTKTLLQYKNNLTRQMHTALRGEPENACMQFVWSRGKRTLPSQPFIVRFSVPSLPVKFSSSLQPLFMVHIF